MRGAKRGVLLMMAVFATAGAVLAQSGTPTVAPRQRRLQASKVPAKRAELARREKELEEKLVAQEKQAWAEEKNQNADFFRETMTPQFEAAEPDGKRYTRAEVLRLIPTVQMTAYELTDFKMIRAGRDAAVLTYRASMRETSKGKESVTNLLATTVWVRRGTAWKMTFHQKTSAP